MIVRAPSCGQRLDDHVAVRVVVADAEDLAAAHAVERLQDGIALMSMNEWMSAGFAGHQRRHRERQELGHREASPSDRAGARPVEDTRSLGFGTFKQPGGGHELHVEGGILAHEHGPEIAQRTTQRSTSTNHSLSSASISRCTASAQTPCRGDQWIAGCCTVQTACPAPARRASWRRSSPCRLSAIQRGVDNEGA
jgi:hypothetical protein